MSVEEDGCRNLSKSAPSVYFDLGLRKKQSNLNLLNMEKDKYVVTFSLKDTWSLDWEASLSKILLGSCAYWLKPWILP